MTPTTGTQPPKADLRRSQLDRSTAMRLAGTEYARFADALDQLTPGDWKLPTDCPGWDVQTVAGHVLGMAEMAASVRDGARQLRSATKAGGVFLDSLTALQVREHAGLTPAALQGKLRKIGPKATRGRRLAPGFIRHRRMPFLQEVGGQPEWWTIGYLTDTILARDPWMHRIDLARATGHSLKLTAEHDGVLVADMSPNGPPATASPTRCTSPAQPAAPGRARAADPSSSSTPSTSAEPCQAASRAPGCSRKQRPSSQPVPPHQEETHAHRPTQTPRG